MSLPVTGSMDVGEQPPASAPGAYSEAAAGAAALGAAGDAAAPAADGAEPAAAAAAAADRAEATAPKERERRRRPSLTMSAQGTIVSSSPVPRSTPVSPAVSPLDLGGDSEQRAMGGVVQNRGSLNGAGGGHLARANSARDIGILRQKMEDCEKELLLLERAAAAARAKLDLTQAQLERGEGEKMALSLKLGDAIVASPGGKPDKRSRKAVQTLQRRVERAGKDVGALRAVFMQAERTYLAGHEELEETKLRKMLFQQQLHWVVRGTEGQTGRLVVQVRGWRVGPAEKRGVPLPDDCSSVSVKLGGFARASQNLESLGDTREIIFDVDGHEEALEVLLHPVQKESIAGFSRRTRVQKPPYATCSFPLAKLMDSGASDFWLPITRWQGDGHIGELRLQSLFVPHEKRENFVGVRTAEEWFKANAATDCVDEYGFRVANHVERWRSLSSHAACRAVLQQRLWNEFKLRVAKSNDLTVFSRKFFGGDGETWLRETASFRKLVHGGLPPGQRERYWLELSGAKHKMVEAHSNYYAALVEKYNENGVDCEKQIRKDLKRTFTGERTAVNSEEGIARVERVLAAYALHNPALGYCQSMNLIVAHFLLSMDEGPSFWLLVATVEDVCVDYYSMGMEGIQGDMSILDALLTEQLPTLKAHLDEQGIPVNLVAMEWLMCLFSTSLPRHTLYRLWDCMFFEGSSVLLGAALAILRENAKTLCQCIDLEQVLQLLRMKEQEVFDAEKFIEQVGSELEKLTPAVMAVRRREISIEIDRD